MWLREMQRVRGDPVVMTWPRIGWQAGVLCFAGRGRGHGARCPKPVPGCPPAGASRSPAAPAPDERVEVPPPPFTDGIFPCYVVPRRDAGQPHSARTDRDAHRHRPEARRAAPLVPRLPRCRPPRPAAPGERRAGVLRESLPCCAASATARSCATGAPACTAGGRASGMVTRRYLLCAHCHNPHQPRFKAIAADARPGAAVAARPLTPHGDAR